MGIHIHPVRLADLLAFIENHLQTKEKCKLFYLNIYGANLALQSPQFRQLVNQADLVYCDGVGVQVGARLLGETLPERMTPPDWIDKLFGICESGGYSVFLLGAKPGVAERAREVIQQSFPNLAITIHHGYFDKHKDSAENRSLVAAINRSKPDLLIVGFGMPLQEQWISENYDSLEASVFLPVGAMLDYVAGMVPRAPRWLTDRGLEWLARLVIEPKRLWRRYVIGIPVFFFYIIKSKLTGSDVSQ